jgi:SAM-dependent methyltransferase
MSSKTKTRKHEPQAADRSDSIDFYDDANHNYEDFWLGRDYEHRSELLALNKLLKNRHYHLAMDYGGGYGRISPVILEHADKLILSDPSTKQLNIARRFLDKYPNVDYLKLKQKEVIPVDDGTLDLLVMVRVSHHLEDPKGTFAAIARSLKPDGEAIIEIANEAHFINRLRYLKQLKPVPKQPIPVGRIANGIADNTPFFNHNPQTIDNLLAGVGLKTIAKLSVSNLRHEYLKQHLDVQRMLAMEKFFQGKLSRLDFGPSIFFMVKKTDSK